MARTHWQWLRLVGNGHRVSALQPLASPIPWLILVTFVSDLGRLFCHPVSMVDLSVTPMHHLMCMGSSATLALWRRWA
jgi:hypothetical protein